ncbi:nucleotidyl transferase AbiEii/AbiGii toxin family protein [Pseudoduganella albidiflava]|uniref:nucleotidyl transferase AbiEii/AbiGii toxin family protein n=1 Tax=Pseudoduganella albidiflava TaxID=321983 RepID=UPI0013F1431C|nr:nucleotidyl transferase AbiEii/AbiGii toxin family protein [Pseudoduganella albidiflava]
MPETLEILRAVQQITRSHDIDHFVIGATARDILMQHVFGIATGRATRDVDFAIAIRDWQQFGMIRTKLIATGQFHEASPIAHRLYFEPGKHGEAYPLDLVPFGAVEHKPHEIAWPPDMHVVMNVAGYGEALQTALTVDVGGFDIRVVSLPGLAALKLLAWADRHDEHTKDALDLRFLMGNYHRAGNFDRLYDEAMDVMEKTGYDISLAGAALLGLDTRRMLAPATLTAMLAILHAPKLRDRLLTHMSAAMLDHDQLADELLQQFTDGLMTEK